MVVPRYRCAVRVLASLVLLILVILLHPSEVCRIRRVPLLQHPLAMLLYFCAVGSLCLLRVFVPSCASLGVSVFLCPAVRLSACAYLGLLACLQGLSVFQGFPVYPLGTPKTISEYNRAQEPVPKDIRKTCDNNTRTAAHTCPHMTKNETQPATTQTNT